MKAKPFLASKWIHFDLLIDTCLMQDLLARLQPVHMLSTLGVAKRGEHEIATDTFLKVWQSYLDTLKDGKKVDDKDYRFYFTACLTRNLDSIAVIDVGSDKEIITPQAPLVQMQMHRFHYSKADSKFHSMSFGQNGISWGIRLSYPQLFQYPETRQVENALNVERFENAKLFQIIREWLRKNTRPTPFSVNGKRVNEPMRIDEKTLFWITKHAELQEQDLWISTSSQ